MKRTLLAVALACATLGAAPAAPSASPSPAPADTEVPAIAVPVRADVPPAPLYGSAPDTFADGSSFVIEVPSNWNGSLLLYSHGYRAPGSRNPAVDDGGEIADLRPILLARGYAMAGSSYASTGWDVEGALRDQMSTLDEFVHRYGKPKKTIAWGHSVGGLISVALAERHPDRFDGVMSMCGMLAGAESTWNQMLDSEYVMKQLLGDPAASLQTTGITDPAANLREARRLFKSSLGTEQGRARMALVAAFNEEPTWAIDRSEPPAPIDTRARIDAMLSLFEGDAMPFAFLARAELEHRAGGNPSTNEGESYLTAFRTLPQRDLIAQEYQNAGLDLEADLKFLDAGTRIAALPSAATYLRANVDVGGTLPVPVITMHTIADGLAPVENERTYAETVPVELRASHLRQVFVNRSGHCAFTSAETLVVLETLMGRLRNGSWSNLDPEDLNESAQQYGDALNSYAMPGADSQTVAPAFTEYVPKAFLR